MQSTYMLHLKHIIDLASWHKPRNLGFQAEAYYMSESDPALRERIRKLYRPKKLSKDCRKYRGILPEPFVEPTVDQSVCVCLCVVCLLVSFTPFLGVEKLIHIFGSGFPCQPFSAIGKKKGAKDKRSQPGVAEPQLQKFQKDNLLLDNSS